VTLGGGMKRWRWREGVGGVVVSFRYSSLHCRVVSLFFFPYSTVDLFPFLSFLLALLRHRSSAIHSLVLEISSSSHPHH